MQLATTRFGEVTIERDLIFSFSGGIPGFPEEQEFVLLSIGLEDTPFIWMQSVTTPELSFLLVDPMVAFLGYEVNLRAAEQEALGYGPSTELQALVMVSVPDGDLSNATVNLRAPLCFNGENKLALQAILDNDLYSIRHPLFSKGGE